MCTWMGGVGVGGGGCKRYGTHITTYGLQSASRRQTQIRSVVIKRMSQRYNRYTISAPVGRWDDAEKKN